jgi:hypothetical protein
VILRGSLRLAPGDAIGLPDALGDRTIRQSVRLQAGDRIAATGPDAS